MRISKRKLCEFVLRDYAIKKLGWKEYFELSKFPIKEAFKNPNQDMCASRRICPSIMILQGTVK